MSGNDNLQYPSHLRPVPDPGGAAAPVLEPEQGGTPGLTPPLQRGHSRGFITDVLAELGFASPELVQAAVESARGAGRTPESLLLEGAARRKESIVSPEGVPMSVEVASYGDRLAAFILDSLFWTVATVLLVVKGKRLYEVTFSSTGAAEPCAQPATPINKKNA